MKKQSNEEIILYMNELKSSDIEFLLNNLPEQSILTWSQKVPYKDSIQMIARIGARQSFYILSHIDLDKAVAIWKIVRTKTLIQVVLDIGASDAVQIGKAISLADIRVWKKKHAIQDISFFTKYLGTDTVVEFYQEISMIRIVQLLDIFSKEEIIGLFFKVKNSKSPKITAKQLEKLKTESKTKIKPRIKKIPKNISKKKGQ